MPTPTLVKGAPCWIDLFSSDTKRAKEFYGRLFGWTTGPGPEYGGYFIFQKDGKAVAGCMGNKRRVGPPRLLDHPPQHRRRRPHRRRHSGEGRPGARRTDGRDPERPLRHALRPRRRRDRRLAATRGEGLRCPRPARHGCLVRAAHGRLRARGRLLPRRLRLGDAHRGRLGRLPLHDPGRGREPRSPGSWTRRRTLPKAHPRRGTVYFEVEDVDASLEQVAELGGKIERETAVDAAAAAQR